MCELFEFKLAEKVISIAGGASGEGAAYRVDMRLRPHGSIGRLSLSLEETIRYYQSDAREWEQQVLIRSRAIAGEHSIYKDFYSNVESFVYQPDADVAECLENVRLSRRRIEDPIPPGPGYNVKLGRGGIREIEFFAQTQQLIAGGRNPHLRDRDTLTTLDKLCEDKWIDEAARDAMKEAYRFLRTVEHRLQMMNDEQTQTLPAERGPLERFARFLGFADRNAFAKVLLSHLDKVQRYYARLFEKAPEANQPALSFPADADDHKTLDRLSELGFRAPLEASGIVRLWLSGDHRSLKGEAAREHLKALLPALLEHLIRTDNPNATLVLFDHFLANLHGPGWQNAREHLLRLLVGIGGLRQRLVQALGGEVGDRLK